MLSTELTNAVRAECGKVINTTDIEDGDITRESGYILNRINDKITKKAYRSITSQADVREYAVHTNTLRVLELLPHGFELQELVQLGSTSTIVTGAIQSGEYYNFPSLWAIEMSRRVRGLPRMRWEFNPVERKLKIDPTPTQTGDLYWYISVEKSEWTLAALPADFEELVVTGVTWKALEIIALRRSTEGGILREGGRVDYPADAIKRFADSKKDDFFTELEFKARVYNM